MIVVISGVPNAGKTHVARALVKKLPRAINFELDYLFQMFDHIPLAESIGMLFEGTEALLPVFVKNGFDIVVSYPLSEHWYKTLKAAIEKTGEPYLFFTIKPPLELVLKDRGNRPVSESLAQRIRELYGEDEINNPMIGEFLDNSNESAEATAERILGRIAGGSSHLACF